MSAIPEVKPIRKILAATDLSEASEPAVHAAALLARDLGAELHVVHALAEALDPRLDFLTEDFAARLHAAAETELKSFASRIPDGAATAVRVEVKRGYAIDVILEDIKELRADLLVVGTHGHTGLKHLALGSVAEHLASVVPIDVLMVRKAVDTGFRRGLVGVRPDRVAFRAAARAIQVGTAIGLDRLDLASAFSLPMGWDHIAGSYTEHIEKMRDIQRSELGFALEAVKAAGLTGKLHCEDGSASEVLLAAADELGSDIVFLGSHNRPRWTAMLLGNTARDIAHRLPTATWLVRSLPEKHPVIDTILRDLGLK